MGDVVIVPLADQGVIAVEHDADDNPLLRVMEGTTARVTYRTSIANGWATS